MRKIMAKLEDAKKAQVWVNFSKQQSNIVKLRSRSRSQVRSRSGPGQVPGQVQKVQGLRAKDLDLG